ncbi:MAG: hypothetical protein CM15mV19_0930 [uncultured marine virus]|nr:MAG: hypothetical protein CM15mV19_0930 [uncultured marine virus]
MVELHVLSQITKLVTLDLLDNGKPIDYTGTLDQWFSLSEEQKKKVHQFTQRTEQH